MNRCDRRNLVKIRRLAEQTIRQAGSTADQPFEVASGIMFEIDNVLQKNGCPYTGTDRYGFTVDLEN